MPERMITLTMSPANAELVATSLAMHVAQLRAVDEHPHSELTDEARSEMTRLAALRDLLREKVAGR